MVLIWKYAERAIQWIPTRQGLGGLQKALHPCTKVASALEGLNHGPIYNHSNVPYYISWLYQCQNLMLQQPMGIWDLIYFRLCSPLPWHAQSFLHLPFWMALLVSCDLRKRTIKCVPLPSIGDFPDLFEFSKENSKTQGIPWYSKLFLLFWNDSKRLIHFFLNIGDHHVKLRLDLTD